MMRGLGSRGVWSLELLSLARTQQRIDREDDRATLAYRPAPCVKSRDTLEANGLQAHANDRRTISRKHHLGGAISCALLLVCAAAAHAYAVLEYSDSTVDCHADFARVAIQGLSLRIDSAPPSQDISLVYDAAEKVGVALDHKRRQFFEMEYDDDAIDFQSDVMKSTSNMVDRKTEQMVAQLPPEVRSSMKQQGANNLPQIDPKAMEQMMQQSLQSMPKEQRAQMEAAMKNLRTSGYPGFGSQTEPVIEVTGEKREVNALSCALERVTQDGALVREDCRTTLDALGLEAADLKRLQRAIARMQKFASAITDNLRLARGMNRDHADPQHLLIERRCFEEGKPIGEVTLRVRQQAAPAEWFVTPPGYSRMDMGMHGR